MALSDYLLMVFLGVLSSMLASRLDKLLEGKRGTFSKNATITLLALGFLILVGGGAGLGWAFGLEWRVTQSQDKFHDFSAFFLFPLVGGLVGVMYLTLAAIWQRTILTSGLGLAIALSAMLEFQDFTYYPSVELTGALLSGWILGLALPMLSLPWVVRRAEQQ